MSAGGRTAWLPKDAAWHRRGRVVELGQRHGGAAVNALDWMMCEARTQNPVREGKGFFKTGYAAIAHGAFLPSAQDAREVVLSCVDIGLLDEFDPVDDRTFQARISGWNSDVNMTLDAARKAAERAAKKPEMPPADSGQPGTTSGLVPERPEESPTRQDSKEQLPVEPSRLDEARIRLQAEQVQQVFDAWIEATGRTGRTVLDDKRRRRIRNALKTYPLDDVLAAVRGWRNSPHHRGENQTGTVYNDLDLLLRDGEHIERFRDLDGPLSSTPSETPSERAARFNARYGDHAA